jgi:hypothetical protein
VYRAALRFVGRDLPARLDPFDIETYFTLSREDIAAVRENFTKHHFLVGLQIAVLRATGQFLGRSARIPPELLNHFAQVFGDRSMTLATPRAVYKDGQSTLYAHQKWAREHAQFRDFDDDVSRELGVYGAAKRRDREGHARRNQRRRGRQPLDCSTRQRQQSRQRVDPSACRAGVGSLPGLPRDFHVAQTLET